MHINADLASRRAGRLSVLQSPTDGCWYVVEHDRDGQRRLVEGPVSTKLEAEGKARMLREHGVPL